MRHLWMMTVTCAALLCLPVRGDTAATWEFAYEAGQIYTYKLNSRANVRFQNMKVSPGVSARAGDELHRSFDIAAKLEFHIDKAPAGGNAEATARFREFKMTLGYRADKPTEMNGDLHDSKAVKGEQKEVVLTAEDIAESSFKIVLPRNGGLVIKDKMAFLESRFGKLLKEMDKHDKSGYSKRYKELLEAGWWQGFLSKHFLELPKNAKVPGPGHMILTLFLGGNHTVVSQCLDQKKGCEMKFVSLSRDDSANRVDLGIRFDVDRKDGLRNYSVLKTHHVPQVTYSRSTEGHMLYAPYEIRLANYSGDDWQGDEYLIDIKSLCEFESRKATRSE